MTLELPPPVNTTRSHISEVRVGMIVSPNKHMTLEYGPPIGGVYWRTILSSGVSFATFAYCPPIGGVYWRTVSKTKNGPPIGGVYWPAIFPTHIIYYITCVVSHLRD